MADEQASKPAPKTQQYNPDEPVAMEYIRAAVVDKEGKVVGEEIASLPPEVRAHYFGQEYTFAIGTVSDPTEQPLTRKAADDIINRSRHWSCFQEATDEIKKKKPGWFETVGMRSRIGQPSGTFLRIKRLKVS